MKLIMETEERKYLKESLLKELQDYLVRIIPQKVKPKFYKLGYEITEGQGKYVFTIYSTTNANNFINVKLLDSWSRGTGFMFYGNNTYPSYVVKPTPKLEHIGSVSIDYYSDYYDNGKPYVNLYIEDIIGEYFYPDDDAIYTLADAITIEEIPEDVLKWIVSKVSNGFYKTLKYYTQNYAAPQEEPKTSKSRQPAYNKSLYAVFDSNEYSELMEREATGWLDYKEEAGGRITNQMIIDGIKDQGVEFVPYSSIEPEILSDDLYIVISQADICKKMNQLIKNYYN